MNEELNRSAKRVNEGRFSFTRSELLSEIGHLEDALHATRNERDEARAAIVRLQNAPPTGVKYANPLELAYADRAGFERGVREAAKEIEKIAAILDHHLFTWAGRQIRRSAEQRKLQTPSSRFWKRTISRGSRFLQQQLWRL